MILALFFACSGPRSAADLPPADPPPSVLVPAPAADAPATDAPSGVAPGSEAPVDGLAPVDGAGEPGPAPVGGPHLTPAQSYAGCQDRLEGPQTAGECKSDTDCARVGCSSEVCTAAVTAPDVMTTCEILPCFQAVESCGCHEGMCTWTLKSVLPTPGRVNLPAKQP